MKEDTKKFLIINVNTEINSENFEKILPEKISIMVVNNYKKMVGIELNIFSDKEFKRENKTCCEVIKKLLNEYYVSENTILISDNTKVTNRALRNLFSKHNMDFIEFSNCVEIGDLISNYLKFKLGEDEEDFTKYDNIIENIGIDYEKYEEGSLNICNDFLNILKHILNNEYSYELFV